MATIGLASLALLLGATSGAWAGGNLVTNGDFSSNGGVGELGPITYATG